MTPRERVQAALRFERPDRLPCNESPWRQTVERWRREGLPPDVELADFFGFDICMMFVDPSPRFEMKILDRAKGYFTYEDRYGYTIRKEEAGESTIDFLDHKNKDRRSWEELIKPRLVLSDDADEPARLDDQSYFGHFDAYPTWEEAAQKFQRLYATDRYMLFMFYGPWEAAWRHRGFEQLLMDAALDPAWLEDMAGTHVDLLIAVLMRCLALWARPDGIMWAEDLGHNSGPLFSPETWDCVFRPHYQRFGEFLRGHGIDFWMHSDGRLHSYPERLLQVGVQCLNPLQVNAGMDVVELREQLGSRLAFYGGIDAQKMSASEAELAEELERKIPLASRGGLILHSDHSVPPSVSLAQFRWMQQRSQEIFVQS